ncbi:VOC family protein [Salinibacterium sp. M195]|uniref:VOC family protein n=1 Tax=Salinibacterium sp. M195 TaxID=2583374 RepID=UPI001C63499E|nr:VOC family protein [Salinibacterium sp. M195]QYH35263.1 VOC family protein [Salinibacterium sp. M195]
MSAITPCLWFDHSAEEAAAFYVDAFPRAAIRNTTNYPTEGLADFQKDFAGDVLTVDFEIAGQRLLALNAGDLFTFTSAISFMVNFDPSVDPDARHNLDALWEKLIDGGEALMPLDEYPFSSRYGWVRDKFGVNWQLMLTDPTGEPRPMIIPSLLFGSSAQNRAHEATEYYLSVFDGSKMGTDIRHAEQTGPAIRAAVNFSDFRLRDQWFVAMDAGIEQESTFTEAVSFVVPCADQAEIDRYWEALSAVPEAEACGWCKDQFGVSWQITPHNIDELMKRPDAFDHMMEMKKIEMAKL